MALKDITITGSIGTHPTLSYGQKMYVSSTDEQSFPIEEVIGSNGGSMPNLFGQTSSIDIYSPINQQWSGSTLTPVGMVNYIHSSQDEFINGEFSGSALEVSHQSLIDKDCETYLTVSTVPTYYKPFIYNAVDTPFSEGNFLNPDTSPNNGEIYIFDNKIINSFRGISIVPGVTNYYFEGSIKYIKINRFDVSGADNTLSLQELTNLRIKFSDIGIVDYPILTITEYPTYYLYLVNVPIKYRNPYQSFYFPFFPTPAGPTPPATPYTVDNNVIMHQLVTSAVPYYIPAYSTYNGNTLVASIDNNSYFNPITGLYTFGDTPNVEMYYTASFFADDTFIGSMTLYGATSFLGTSTTFNAGFGYRITGSFTPIENQQYTFKITNAGGVGATVSRINFQITQSIASHTSSNLTILEPYLITDFYYDDCNVLFGNVLDLEYDSNFYQVNYDEGSVIPSNQAQILNGTAEIAPVKSYNYAARAQIYPRYVGTKVVQQQMNVWTKGDIAPSRTPSVQSLGTYFAYFENAGGTNPEIIGKRGLKIKFLIDTSGSIIQPTLNNDIPYYNNLIDLFPGGQNVSIVPYISSGDVSQIQGIHSVLQPGVVPKPLLYNQITSNDIIIPSMSFNGTAGVPNYNTNLALTPGVVYPPGSLYGNILDVIIPSSPTQTLFSTETVYNSVPSTDRNIEIINSTATTQLIPVLTITLSIIGSGVIPPGSATISILKESSGVWAVIATQNIVLTSTIQTYTLTALPQVITATNKYRVVISSPGVAFGKQIAQWGGTFTLGQTTPPSSLILTAPYWTTGVSSPNILTGSTQINSGIYGLTQTDVLGSGYTNGTLPFTVQRLDEIRFSADENQVYQVLGVESPLESVDGRLYITLDRNIVSGTNLASFFLRRMYPDPTFVLMNVPATGGGLSGFIYPEYITQDLTNNLSSIITDLQQKNLI